MGHVAVRIQVLWKIGVVLISSRLSKRNALGKLFNAMTT
jgi:hypothetical protein